MIIPFEKIPPETLQNLIESFISREGTDYGSTEHSLDEKVEQVKKQLQNRQVFITYDQETESVTMLTKDQAASLTKEDT